MARRRSSFLDDLIEVPWQVGIILSGVVYLLSNFIIPNLQYENKIFQGVAQQTVPTVGPMVAFLCFACGLLSFIKSWGKRKQLDSQTGINSIKSIDWKQFEELVGEAYRRQGYTVIENPGAGPDGGVDLKLKKDSETTLVQCKQWRTSKVGVKVVRELYGVMTAEDADNGIIVTSGAFTPDAKDFVAGKAIELIEGNQLTALIRDVQQNKRIESVPEPKSVPDCPRCGSEMKLRTARKGKYAGQQFWGCSGFPKCRGTVNI